jgi:hypothetical protein
MKTTALLSCLFVFALQAQDTSSGDKPTSKEKKLWAWSLAALAAGNVADTQSSWRAPESNRLLADSRGRFGWQSAGIKFGLQAPLVAFQLWQAHKHPSARLYKTYTITNFAVGGAFGAAAIHNYKVRQPGQLP